MGIELWRVTQKTRELLGRITGRPVSKSFAQDLRILTPLLARVYHLQPEAVEALTLDRVWMYLEDLEAELEKRNLQDWAKGEIQKRISQDDSAWVPANQLWTEKFSSNKELTRFRQQHPGMFRNPSKFRLEIHAGLWASYWAERSKAGFEALDGDLPSVADDSNVQADALAEAAQRVASLREKKRRGKQ